MQSSNAALSKLVMSMPEGAVYYMQSSNVALSRESIEVTVKGEAEQSFKNKVDFFVQDAELERAVQRSRQEKLRRICLSLPADGIDGI